MNGQILKPFLLRMGIRMSAVTAFIQYTLALLASAMWQEGIGNTDIRK